jgi:hypothetical protein
MGKSNKNSLRGRRNSLKGGRKRRNSLKRGRKRRVRGGSLKNFKTQFKTQFETYVKNEMKDMTWKLQKNYLTECIDKRKQDLRTLINHDQKDNPNLMGSMTETQAEINICTQYLKDINVEEKVLKRPDSTHVGQESYLDLLNDYRSFK